MPAIYCRGGLLAKNFLISSAKMIMMASIVKNNQSLRPRGAVPKVFCKSGT
jgi:hypothetical protein